MRITGGLYGGRRIRVPRDHVRPTQDRVREALFSIVAAAVPGSRFLDLYAGSGAVGLEALSRGAASVVWVENNQTAFRLLTDNVTMLTASAAGDAVPQAACLRRDVMAYLRCPPAVSFDIVYADPPYVAVAEQKGGVSLCSRLLEALADGRWLAAGGMVVIETAAGDAGVQCSGWDLIQTRSYGKTALSFYQIRER